VSQKENDLGQPKETWRGVCWELKLVVMKDRLMALSYGETTVARRGWLKVCWLDAMMGQYSA